MLDTLQAMLPDRLDAPERILWVLAALVVVGFVWFLLSMRRINRDASAVSAYDDVTASFNGSFIGNFKRAIPVVLIALTLATLLTGLVVKPIHVESEPFEQATILPLLDTSNTSTAIDRDDPSSIPRIERGKQGLDDFLVLAPERMLIGLSTFDTNVRMEVPPTTDREAVREALDDIETGKQTDIPNALIEMARLAERTPTADDGTIPARIVLFSDGKIDIANEEEADKALSDAIEFVNSVGVPVYTVIVGTENEVTIDSETGSPTRAGVDVDVMERIAYETGGKPLVSTASEPITAFFEEVGSSLGTQEVETPALGVFILTALVLLALAGLSRLFFFYQRKPKGSKPVSRLPEMKEESIFREVA